MVAGHSLGELSALVAADAVSFEDGLKLVYARAMAMQKACEAAPGTMAAVIGLSDEVIEQTCAVNAACEKLKAAGAKRALPLKVGGAFHSPLMQPAKEELEKAIQVTTFSAPLCPVYQNVDGLPHTDPSEIKANLIAQLTSSVRWTSSVKNMIKDGADLARPFRV